jgi:hypothetical protein
MQHTSDFMLTKSTDNDIQAMHQEFASHQQCVDMIVAWKVPAASSSLMQQWALRGSGMECRGPKIIAACELDRLTSTKNMSR